jgi:hypothetical protein
MEGSLTTETITLARKENAAGYATAKVLSVEWLKPRYGGVKTGAGNLFGIGTKESWEALSFVMSCKSEVERNGAIQRILAAADILNNPLVAAETFTPADLSPHPEEASFSPLVDPATPIHVCTIISVLSWICSAVKGWVAAPYRSFARTIIQAIPPSLRKRAYTLMQRRPDMFPFSMDNHNPAFIAVYGGPPQDMVQPSKGWSNKVAALGNTTTSINVVLPADSCLVAIQYAIRIGITLIKGPPFTGNLVDLLRAALMEFLVWVVWRQDY